MTRRWRWESDRIVLYAAIVPERNSILPQLFGSRESERLDADT